MHFLIRPSTLFFFGAVLFFLSCKKNKIDTTSANFKVLVLAGNNQSDTIGKQLKDSLKISALEYNKAFSKARIKIIQPGCADTKEFLFITDNNGIISLPWQLNSGIGDQTLKIYLLDSLNNVLDSTLANAKGLFFEHCWLPTDCIPKNASNESIVELPDGTILCGLGKLYSSANNGQLWNLHQTYPNQFSTYDVINFGSHVFTLNSMNIQHSSDNGQTWMALSNTLDIRTSNNMEVTNKGKLFINTIAGVYMSFDFGQNWTNISIIPNGLGYANYYYNFCEMSNGTIYAVNNLNELWTSIDGGTTWTSTFVNNGFVSVYVDDKDDLYIGSSGLNEGDLYRKRKNENGSTLICSFPNTAGQIAEITQISKVNNFFYFLVSGYGLMKTSNFISFENLKPSPIDTYLITKSNFAIVTGASFNSGQIIFNKNP